MRRGRLALTLTVVFGLTAPAADAFDTGPHADLTRDALRAEGFGRAAADVGMVENWLTDYYTNPSKNPWSGHAGFWVGLTTLGFHENWLSQWIAGAGHMHFDSSVTAVNMPDLATTAGIEKEWQRLMYLTRKWVRYYGQRNDALGVMAILGQSLHAIQDFYAHSNWVEAYAPEPGRWGPGAAAKGWGDVPTFFDVAPQVRDTWEIYVGNKPIPRNHGNWRTDDNTSSFNGLNKDWPGRPWFAQAYMSAYFASVQWIQAVRDWLGNLPLWRRAQQLSDSSKLRRDVQAATDISLFSGHWQGAGEPAIPILSDGERTGKGGSITSLKIAIDGYHIAAKSPYRKAFEGAIGAWNEYPAQIPSMADLPSTRATQSLTRFVRVDIDRYQGKGLTDPVGEADDYADAGIGPQAFTSSIINGEDSFAFPRPYHAWEWIKALPTTWRASTPVTDIVVRIETGNRSYAGTDDDVYLRVNGSQRFRLDKSLYNDFERGDDDTYAAGLDGAVKAGLTIGDIDRLVIEKSRDGIAGGWFLHGVTIKVNGRVLVADRHVDRWLEDDKRSWTATGWTRDHRTRDVVGIWMQIKDDDTAIDGDDTGDLNRYDRNTVHAIAYVPGTTVTEEVQGDDVYRGRLSADNGDRVKARWRIQTIVPKPPPQPGVIPPGNTVPTQPTGTVVEQPTTTTTTPTTTTTTPLGQPDLTITALDPFYVTVTNQGTAAAGAFTVSVGAAGSVRFASGLAVGASQQLRYHPGSDCGGDYHAMADSAAEIAESDETNNAKDLLGVIC